MRRDTRSAALLLIAMLLLGTTVGVIGTVVAARNGVGALHYHKDRGPRGPREFFDRLTRDLALTEVQQDSVQAILEANRAEVDSLWKEMSPRFETLRMRLRSEIRAQLSPAQQITFDEMSRRNDSMRNRGSAR